MADSQDMSSYIYKQDTQNRSIQTLNRFVRLEQFLFNQMSGQEQRFALKDLNVAALNEWISHSSVRNIHTIFLLLDH